SARAFARDTVGRQPAAQTNAGGVHEFGTGRRSDRLRNDSAGVHEARAGAHTVSRGRRNPDWSGRCGGNRVATNIHNGRTTGISRERGCPLGDARSSLGTETRWAAAARRSGGGTRGKKGRDPG